MTLYLPSRGNHEIFSNRLLTLVAKVIVGIFLTLYKPSNSRLSIVPVSCSWATIAAGSSWIQPETKGPILKGLAFIGQALEWH